MISIKIICVGFLKETYLKNMEQEYLKRLSKYCKIEIIELKDEKLPNMLNEANINITKAKEGALILSKLSNLNSYNFIMDEKGKEYSSIELSDKLSKILTNGYSTISFVIGGSLGLDKKVKDSGNELISFSRLTFPHQLIRMFLLEQLFRVFKIQNNEAYHH